MFTKKTNLNPTSKKSLLTQMLQDTPDVLSSPFLEYAKFDGIVSLFFFIFGSYALKRHSF